MTTLPRKGSAFAELGLTQTVALLKDEIRHLYQADHVPWIIGYSGGKDSTAVLQLIWSAVSELPPESRKKTVHVISTDTLVENPIVASWVNGSLAKMKETAARDGLPFSPHRLTPDVSNSFWVNLIGRGYPAPRPKFRWCTDRLKIKPSNAFIGSVVRETGEAILVLGTRKAESQARARVMANNEKYRLRDRLSPNATLPGCLIYSPIEDWLNDDVWLFLMQVRNAWGYNNKDLLTMYQGASADGECPLVVDTSTPSCGDSRFGCWVCTMVERDKSMTAMIQNDREKEWMTPLLDLRNELDVADDRHLRDFRRMNGNVNFFHDRTIPGPYTQEARENWLTRLLEAQNWIRQNGPADVRNIELITIPELEEVRRLWVVEKHEFEDNLPKIYQKVMGATFPGKAIDDNLPLGADEVSLLKELCGDDRLHFELIRELIDVERQHRSLTRRSGMFEALEQSIKRGYYEDQAEATERAKIKEAAFNAVRQGQVPSILQDGAPMI